MKTTKLLLPLLLFSVTFSSAFALGSGGPGKEKDKIISQARKLAKEADQGDWFSYALAADKCIRIGENLEEARKWIEQSTSIKETGYNLSIEGDFFMKKGDLFRAIESYERSLAIGSLNEEGFDPAKVQTKLMRARRI